MKKSILCFLVIIFSSNCFAQVLFFGTYKQPQSGKNYTCWDRVMEYKVYETEAEAQEIARSFRTLHAKYEPIVKIFLKGAVIIFSFDYNWSSFNCTTQSFSWEQGVDSEDAEKKFTRPNSYGHLNKKSIFAWQGKTAN